MKEIERKFLIPKMTYKGPRYEVEIKQFYITELGKKHEIRLRHIRDVRREIDKYEMTEKIGEGLEREESTLVIDGDTFDSMNQFRKGGVITKTRLLTGSGSSIDIYQGLLSPLVVGEIEFDSVEKADAFNPSIFPILKDAIEVTGVRAFSNRSLANALSYEQVIKQLSRNPNVGYAVHKTRTSC